MKITLIVPKKTTTGPPYTQIPPDRIQLHYKESWGMILLPKNAELQEKHPQFWEMLQHWGIKFRADPAQMDPPLFRSFREKIGIKIETSDIELATSLLGVEEPGRIFYETCSR